MLPGALLILAVLCRSSLTDAHFVGYAQIIPDWPVIQRDSAITLACILDNSHLSYSNSGGVLWKLDNDLVPRNYYAIINETTSTVTIPNFTAASALLQCCIDTLSSGHEQVLARTTLTSGYSPEEPQNISCIYFHEKNFTCVWATGRDTELPTHYSMVTKGPLSTELTCHTTNNSCSIHYPYLHYNYDYEVWVKAENALGKATSNVFTMSTLFLAKTAPPAVTSVSGWKQNLSVSWLRPLLAPSGLPVKCKVRSRPTNSTEWVTSNEVYIGMEESAMFMVTGLLPNTEYAVSVQCICTVGQILWSDWSAEKTGRTQVMAPSRKVDLWRTIDSSEPSGDRIVHLMWKDFQPQSSGKTLGYRVAWHPENNNSLTVMSNITEQMITFKITKDAYLLHVVAYNSVGDSPTAILRIPPIGEKPRELLTDLQTFTDNEHLLLRWTPSEPAGDGYVVEWCVDSDTEVCTISWVYIPNGTAWTAPKGNFQPLRCYNVSVYPIFEAKAEAPLSTQIYVAEGPPQRGPASKAENLGKYEVTLKWENIPKDERNGFITNYTIVYTAHNQNKIARTVSPDIQQYTLKNLQSNTLYNVYIIASTKAGSTNGTSIHFSTLNFDKKDITVVIAVCMLSAIPIIIAVLYKRHKLKHLLWPDVPSPAASSLAEWFEDTPKMDLLLPIKYDSLLFVENINVLDFLSYNENQTDVIKEYPMNGLDLMTMHKPYPCFKELDGVKPPSPFSYVTADNSYKSQVSPVALIGPLSGSRTSLIQGLCSQDAETPEAREDETFIEDTVFNPYLKHKVMTRQFLYPGNFTSLNEKESSQPLMKMSPDQQKGLEEIYVTVDMVGLNMVH